MINRVLLNLAEGKGLKEPKAEAKKATQTLKPGQREDLTRQTGDLAVYAYYFKFIGWRFSLLYLFFVALDIGSPTFSREFLSP